MRRWPDTLPPTTSEGFELTPVDQSDRTNMEVGAQRVYRRSKARLYRVGMNWVMSDAQMAVFSDWFDDRRVSISGASDTLASWGTANAIVAQAQSLSPDLVAVDRISETAVDGQHNAWANLPEAAANGLPLALTATLRAAGRSLVRFILVGRDGVYHSVTANLISGLVTGQTGLPSAIRMIPRGNGWHRVSFEASVGTGLAIPFWAIELLDGSGANSYAGIDGAGVDVCEVQARVRTGYDLFCPCDAGGYALGAAGGSAWFTIPLATGGGIGSGEARFAAMWRGGAKAGLNWQVSGQLEVRNA